MQPFHFDSSLTYVFLRASTAVRTGFDKSLQAAGLNAGQIFVMTELWKAGGKTQSELAAALGVAAPTVSKMVKSLAERGFVVSERDAADSRVTRIRLTEAGLAVREPVARIWTEAESAAFGELTETERLILSQLVAKIPR